MSIGLRILLITAATVSFLYVIRKIRQSHVRIMDMFLWLVVSVLLIAMALFPAVVIRLSYFLGFESATNFVFVVIIFFLLFKCFSLSIQSSEEKERLNRVIEEFSIRFESEHEDNPRDIKEFKS